MSFWLNLFFGANHSLFAALICCASLATLFAYVVKSVKWTSAVRATLKELRLYRVVAMWYAKTFPRGKNQLDEVFDVIDTIQTTPCKFYNRFFPLMYIDKPEDLQILLNHSNALEKADIYRFFGEISGDSVVAVPVSEWKPRRRVMKPFFSSDKLEAYSRPMFERGQLELKKLKTWADTDQVLDLWDFLAALNVKLATETLMGLNPETNFTDSERKIFIHSIRGLTERFMHRIVHVWSHLDILYAVIGRFNGWFKLEGRLCSFWEKIIQCRRKMLMETSGKAAKQDVIFLDAVSTFHTMQGRKDISTSLVQDIGFMYAAGSETSSISECFTLLMLAMNPRIQEEVCQEITQVLGTEDDEKPITVEDVENMPLLDRCVKESLRLYPVVPLFGRRVTATITLSNGEVAEKDMNVLVSVYHLHRKPELYDNPSTFDPDNFLPERVQKRHPYSYLPFSAGPRGCLGRRYAMVSVKILLATMVRKYRFSTDMKPGDLKHNLDLLIRSSDGWKVRMYTRR